MSKSIAVIFGAGASYDLVPDHQKNKVEMNSDYRPPLTPNLFDLPRELERILNKYPRANTAIGYLRSKIADGQSLETLLKLLYESEAVNKKSQFRQIPLYLRDLFGVISTNYCNHPTNYTTLVSETLSKNFDSVVYVTLNYDLFFEEALRIEEGAPFNNISQYVTHSNKWMFVKLHGSANWGKRLLSISNKGESIEALLDCVSKIDLDKDVDNEIEVIPQGPPGGTNLVKYYPAITVPVDNKYQFNCPQEHLEKLKIALKTCDRVLIIGISGRDKDLIDLLKANLGSVSLVTIVGGKQVEQTKEIFKENIPQFNKGIVGWRTYGDGFSEFIKKNGMETFLEN